MLTNFPNVSDFNSLNNVYGCRLYNRGVRHIGDVLSKLVWLVLLL